MTMEVESCPTLPLIGTKDLICAQLLGTAQQEQSKFLGHNKIQSLLPVKITKTEAFCC